MNRTPIVIASMLLGTVPLATSGTFASTTIEEELDALAACQSAPDRTIMDRLKQFDRAQVAAAIRARLGLPEPPPANSRERILRNNRRINYYRALAEITDQGPDQGRWGDDDVIAMLHFGATQEEEYIRGHVLDTFLLFRDDMPESLRAALVASLTWEDYPTASGSLATFALSRRQGLLPKGHFWGFVFNPEQAHPALWESAIAAIARRAHPDEHRDETLFLTLRLNAADALIRHCDLGEIVAAWRQAADPLGKRALSLAVFRKLRDSDSAFHLAPAETRAEAVRLACQSLDDLPESWATQTGFLLLLGKAIEEEMVRDAIVMAEVRNCLLHIKDLPHYGAFDGYIQAILGRLGD